MFNRGDDYLFDGWADRRSSPLNACLNAGRRTGITGVSDHHGTEWGHPEGVDRAGLWVTENTRAGVLEALRPRRFFATRYWVCSRCTGLQPGGEANLWPALTSAACTDPRCCPEPRSERLVLLLDVLLHDA